MFGKLRALGPQLSLSVMRISVGEKMNNKINHLERELKRFLDVDPVGLRRELLNDLPTGWGIYLICMPNSDKSLYIGISSRLRGRIWSDLLGPSGAHTLKNKLRKNYGRKGNRAIEYLNRCSIRYMAGRENEVTTLEHFAIAVLEPQLND